MSDNEWILGGGVKFLTEGVLCVIAVDSLFSIAFTFGNVNEDNSRFEACFDELSPDCAKFTSFAVFDVTCSVCCICSEPVIDILLVPASVVFVNSNILFLSISIWSFAQFFFVYEVVCVILHRVPDVI